MSMPEMRIVPAVYEHIAPVAIHMRQADRAELMAGLRRSPFEALEYSVGSSVEIRTVLIDDKPAAMFGCGYRSFLTGAGYPWMLATDDIERAPTAAFLRASVDWRDKLFERYDLLKNTIFTENTDAIHWLEWLGFKISAEFPIGSRGNLFRYFEMRASDRKERGPRRV